MDSSSRLPLSNLRVDMAVTVRSPATSARATGCAADAAATTTLPVTNAETARVAALAPEEEEETEAVEDVAAVTTAATPAPALAIVAADAAMIAAVAALAPAIVEGTATHTVVEPETWSATNSRRTAAAPTARAVASTTTEVAATVDAEVVIVVMTVRAREITHVTPFRMETAIGETGAGLNMSFAVEAAVEGVGAPPSHCLDPFVLEIGGARAVRCISTPSAQTAPRAAA